MSRRNKLTTIAQKEEEALQKLKETRRAAPVHMNPEKLGGSGTLDEARRRQLTELRCAKLQKRLKKENADKRRKEEEDEKQQKIKDTQREKAERLALKKQEDEQKRSDQLKPSHLSANNRFLQQFETTAPASSSATWRVNQQLPNTSNVLKMEKNLEGLQLEHKRVNAAFLDGLESRSRSANVESSASCGSHLLQPQAEQQLSTLFQTDPGAGYSGHTAEDGLMPDFECSLKKLKLKFPDYNKDILEDILSECNNNYQQAYDLLMM